MSGGFVSRWSRLKRQGAGSEAVGPVSESKTQDETTGDLPAGKSPSPPANTGALADAPGAPDHAPAVAADAAQALPDLESLKPESDFRPFMQASVDPIHRNAALKKLWASPNFNVMDGLDVYIDDYGKPDPIEPEFLKTLNQARSLGLFEEDKQEPGVSNADLPLKQVDAAEPRSPRIAEPPPTDTVAANGEPASLNPGPVEPLAVELAAIDPLVTEPLAPKPTAGKNNL